MARALSAQIVDFLVRPLKDEIVAVVPLTPLERIPERKVEPGVNIPLLPIKEGNLDSCAGRTTKSTFKNQSRSRV